VKLFRYVAFGAADEEIGRAAAAGAPVPVWASLTAGWAFLFTNIPRILARIWLAVIVLAVLDARLSIDIDLNRMSADAFADLLLFGLIHLLLYALVAASLSSLALGVRERPVIAGLAIGPDELRFLATIAAFFLIAAMLLLGAAIVASQIARLLAYSGGIAQLSMPDSASDIQWLKDLQPIAALVWLGPLTLAALIVVWLGLRYLFVPFHVIALRRLAIFDGLAITKHNTWRLFGLILLLGVTLTLVGRGVVFALDALTGTHVLAGAGDVITGAVLALGEYVAAVAPGHQSARLVEHPLELPSWVAPLLRTLFNLVALTVTTGALARAYQRAAGQ
jgi:hypothetical protein